MSTTIDKKVVEMRFDNKQFESSVLISLMILDYLKNTLKMDGASRGFQAVERAADGISLGGILAGAVYLEPKFETLGNVSMNVVINIADSLFNFVNRAVMSFAEENNMTDFRMQFVPYGNAMKQFADLVVDWDSCVADNVVVAGKVMSIIEADFGYLDEFSGPVSFNGINVSVENAAHILNNLLSAVINRYSDFNSSELIVMSKIMDIISGSIETKPTISPVLDLTDANNYMNQLYHLNDNISNYMFSGSLQLAGETMNSMDILKRKEYNAYSITAIDDLNDTVKELLKRPPETIENTFNINGDNSKEIAEEVSRIIQRQIERRDASWG